MSPFLLNSVSVFNNHPPFVYPRKPDEIDAVTSVLQGEFLSSSPPPPPKLPWRRETFEHLYFETDVFISFTSHFIDPLTCLEMAKNCHIDSKTYLLFVYKQKK